jgi:superoxide dismutase, Fe-Mn family
MAQETEKKSVSAPELLPAYAGGNQVKPLHFIPANLKALSEKLIVSYHKNNYGGGVRRLNQIQQQQVGDIFKDAQPYQMGSLKREEIIATNSIILYEFYFGNLGGDGKSSGTISNGFSGEREQDFRRTGMSLGGGSGRVILNYSYRDNVVHTHWAGKTTLFMDCDQSHAR